MEKEKLEQNLRQFFLFYAVFYGKMIVKVPL